MYNRDIIDVIESLASPALQESWDNTGLQLGSADDPCTGVMLCVDCTPAVVEECRRTGCSLIVSHHPLIFRGLKHITGSTAVEDAVIAAIRAGISIYSCHTAADSAAEGVSHTMAAMLGARVERVLAPNAADPDLGLGVMAVFEPAIKAAELIERIKRVFHSPVVRSTAFEADMPVSRLGLCGGSGGEFIATAADLGAQAYLSSDIRYHDFVDWQHRLLLLDIGHYESEACTKDIFLNAISRRFPRLVVRKSTAESNPIKYN